MVANWSPQSLKHSLIAKVRGDLLGVSLKNGARNGLLAVHSYGINLENELKPKLTFYGFCHSKSELTSYFKIFNLSH